jgi:predicted glycosyltransferase
VAVERPLRPAPRFLLYSHDALGLGHVRRNVVIAGALVERCPDASVLLVTGVDHVDDLGVPDGVDVMRLPSLRKVGNGSYTPRRLTIPGPDLTALRSGILAAAVESFRPSVLLVDKHPLGVGGELRTALRRLREGGGRAVLGLRDILDEPAAVRAEWTPEQTRLVLEHYPRVLVYGSESVFDTLRASALPPELQPYARYCGYVTTPVPRRRALATSVPGAGERGSRPLVIGTTGGGEDGLRVLESFVDASLGAPWHAIAVAGPQLSRRENASLGKRAEQAGVMLRTFVPELQSWLGAADAVVCMGGYNTISEVLARGTPSVCVPRTVPRREQLIRARAFRALGLLQVVEPDRLDGATLRTEIEIALTRSRPALARAAHKALRFDGAETSAELLLEEAAKSMTRVAA